MGPPDTDSLPGGQLSLMQTTVFLYQAADADDSYAISLPGDARAKWRAEKGFGQKFKQVWTIEFQTAEPPSLNAIDWDQVLNRAIEAYTMNDPIITNYTWPTFDMEHRSV